MASFSNNQVIAIWHRVQQGECSQAKHDVVQLLKVQPNCVPAWLLLAEMLDNDEEKAKCYQRVMEIDAHNAKAKQYFTSAHGVEESEAEKKDIPSLFDDEHTIIDSPGMPTSPEDEGLDIGIEFEDDVDQSDSDMHYLTPEDSLTMYIVKELGSHADVDDVIREVSLRGQMDWYLAEKRVIDVKSQYALNIAKRRSPLMLIIAIPTLIAGLIWFVMTGSTVLANSDNSFSFIATLVQSLQNFIGAIAMMLGGAAGIYKVMKSLGKIK